MTQLFDFVYVCVFVCVRARAFMCKTQYLNRVRCVLHRADACAVKFSFRSAVMTMQEYCTFVHVCTVDGAVFFREIILRNTHLGWSKWPSSDEKARRAHWTFGARRRRRGRVSGRRTR